MAKKNRVNSTVGKKERMRLGMRESERVRAKCRRTSVGNEKARTMYEVRKEENTKDNKGKEKGYVQEQRQKEQKQTGEKKIIIVGCEDKGKRKGGRKWGESQSRKEKWRGEGKRRKREKGEEEEEGQKSKELVKKNGKRIL